MSGIRHYSRRQRARFVKSFAGAAWEGLQSLEDRIMMAGQPQITEFMAANNTVIVDDVGQFSDWIELHNSTGMTLDLTGYHLTDNAGDLDKWTLPAVSLAPGEFKLIWASNQNRINPANPLHTNFRLSEDGEYLALVAPDGSTVVQEFVSNGGEYPVQFTDVSYGLDGIGQEVYWLNPTPGAANAGPSTADATPRMVINEIMYHPQSENVADEYIELFNAGVIPLDLDGWQLTDGVSFTFPAVTVNPGEYLVVAADLTAFGVNYPLVTNVVGGWTGQLSNQGERIELSNQFGDVIDRATYYDEGDFAIRTRGPLDNEHMGWVWEAPHDGLGASLELITSSLSNSSGQNWAASAPGGTPGAANGSLDGDVAPLISEVSHSPAIPHTGQSVLVTARFRDELSMGVSGSVFYRVDQAANASPFIEVAMNDSGTGGDAAAGDGIWSAQLPAQAIDGTIVEFYVSATDAGSSTRTWPAPVGGTNTQSANALYQVDNTVYPADQPIYHLIMTEDERAELEEIGTTNPDSNSNARMNGTLISIDSSGGIDVRHNLGIRNRGNGTRITIPAQNRGNNYRLDIPTDRAWKSVTAVNLNVRDTHSQLAGGFIWQMLGLPAADVIPVQVLVNGQDLSFGGDPWWGIYDHVEVLNSDFASAHFPNDPEGNIYRVRRSGGTEGDLEYLGTDPTPYREVYSKESNTSEDDWSDLIHLTDVLDNTPAGPGYKAAIEQVIDLEQWIKYLALDALLNNNETGLNSGIGDDYAMYRGVLDTRFLLVPHDLDTLFGQGNAVRPFDESIFTNLDMPILSKILSRPDIAPLYYKAIKDLAEGPLSPANLGAFFDYVIGDVVDAATLQEMKDYMAQRVDHVLTQQIPSELSVDPLPLTSGFHRVTDTVTGAVTGVADVIQTRRVLVNGVDAAWIANPNAMRIGQWSVNSVTGLLPGINRILVQALGEGDQEIARSFFDVWYDTGTGGGPQVSTIVPAGANWLYLDDGSDQGTAWRASAFVDGGWASGPAELGYGDGDEATVVGFIDTDPGTAGNQRNATTYFRHHFNLTPSVIANTTSLIVRLIRDDGAAVFINGVEVVRDNLAANAAYDTFAASTVTDEDVFLEFTNIPVTMLVPGDNVIAVEMHQRAADSSDISFNLSLQAVQSQDPTLIATGSDWLYLDDGSDQGTAWKERVFAADGTWASGPAQLGYGDGDEATVVGFIDTDPGTAGNQRNATTYFRHHFSMTAADIAALASLTMRYQRDDGAAVYLNGTEIHRTNLAAGAAYNTFANTAISGTDENTFLTVADIDKNLLVEGDNVIAVEMHQQSAGSSDISFDLELKGVAATMAGGVTQLTAALFSGAEPVVTLLAAGGPYQISGNLAVPVGKTLVIEPGTTIYMDTGAILTVNGVLTAVGTDLKRIRFTGIPGAAFVADIRPEIPAGPPHWGGIQFSATMSPQNILSHVDVEYAQSASGSIGATNSMIVVQNSTIKGSRLRFVYANRSSMTIRNNVFPDMFTETDAPQSMTPPLDNVSEFIKGEGGIPVGGHFIIDGNLFGRNKGHNDIIDVDSEQLPLAVVQVINNIFLGAGDEAIDGGGDYYVAGNVFMNFRKDIDNDGTGDSNVISTGDNRAGQNQAVTVIARNVFYNNDHVVNFKKLSFGFFEQNTVVGIAAPHISQSNDTPIRMLDFSVINFLIPNIANPLTAAGRDPAGKGAYVAGNFFADVPQNLFGHVDLDPPGGIATKLQVENNMIPAHLAWETVGRGSGNTFYQDEVLVQAPPVINSGDLAAMVNFLRHRTSMLSAGFGMNGLDFGVAPNAATLTGAPTGTTTEDGATLTVAGPGMFHYQWRLVTNGLPGAWSGELQLGTGTDHNVAVIDRDSQIVLSGLADGAYSVEVLGQDFAGVWQTTPTASATWIVDAAFTPAPVPGSVRINEVLARNVTAWQQGPDYPDMVELHNPGDTPVSLEDMSLSDDAGDSRKFVFGVGAMLGPGEYLVLTPAQLGFDMDGQGDSLRLFDSLANGGGELDAVVFGQQVEDHSIGRDEQSNWTLTQPTPGAANIAQRLGDASKLRINEWYAAPEVHFDDDFIEIHNSDPLPVALGGLYLTDNPAGDPTKHTIAPLSFIGGAGVGVTTLLSMTDSWSYEQSGALPAVDWFSPVYDDSAWPAGQGGFHNSTRVIQMPRKTQLTLGSTAYYFRTEFNWTGVTTETELQINGFFDDGAVFYLNGQELARVGMTAGAVAHSTLAGRIVEDARIETIVVPGDLLAQGLNVLAVEIHQAAAVDADIAFAMSLNALDRQDRNLQVFIADGTSNGPAHKLNFKLDPDHDAIGLFDASLNPIDIIILKPQGQDVSQGRSPNSALSIQSVQLPNPGLDNPNSQVVTSTVNYNNIMLIDHVWDYLDSGADLGTAWIDPNYVLGAGWDSGPGVLYHEPDALPAGAPKNTHLDGVNTGGGGVVTYYFRTTFTLPAVMDINNVMLNFDPIIDDGAIFYLNGQEIRRVNMGAGTVIFSTFASSAVGNATFNTAFSVPGGALLQPGVNHLAVEVHQQSGSSSDVVFGLRLSASESVQTLVGDVIDPNLLAMVQDLRITELMYHPDGDSDAEFIEIKNTGASTLDLTGVRLREGIDFTFGAMSLNPGQIILLVKDQAAFEARYGLGLPVVGVYTGSLANEGEKLRLQLPNPWDAAVLNFDYEDDWYPVTDGGGASLVTVDQNAPAAAWDGKGNWRPSLNTNGSPGVDDVADSIAPVVTASQTLGMPVVSVSYTFSEHVLANLLSVELEHGVSHLISYPASLSVDLPSHTVTFTLPAGLASGSYTATLITSQVTDPAGNPADANGLGQLMFNVGLRGDFNSSNTIDDSDIDLLFAAINAGTHDPFYDLTGDSLVTIADMDEEVLVILGTFYGDANLDLRVSIGDLTILAENFNGTGGWAQGDFTGNGIISIGDLTILAENFGAGEPLTASGDGAQAAGLQALGDGPSSGGDSPLTWNHIQSAMDQDDEDGPIDLLAELAG